jgi:hypothetical protein
MHLVNGDYILIGPDHFEDVHTSRTRDNQLWFLSREPGATPVKLGQKMSEGAAISKKSLKIAFSQVAAQAPELAPESFTTGGGGPGSFGHSEVGQSENRLRE